MRGQYFLPALHLHHPIQHLQQVGQCQFLHPKLFVPALRIPNRFIHVHRRVFARVLIFLLPIIWLLTALAHGVLEVVKGNVNLVHPGAVEHIKQLLGSLDLFQGHGDDVALGVIGDCLYG